MAVYAHLCNNCNKEFELEYSIKANPPDTCPLCNFKGKVKRLISGTNGRVELYGHELKQHLKEEGQKFKRDVHNSESLYANVLGEDKYEQVQKRIDKQKR